MPVMVMKCHNTNITHTRTYMQPQIFVSPLYFFFYSGCPKLFWGEDCVNNCPDKCTGCNNINGLCEYGCLPGWKGNLCNEGIIKFFCLSYPIKW